MSTSVFEQVTSSLTVMSICDSLGPDIPADALLSDLERLLAPGEDPNFDAFIDPCPIRNSDGDLVGILDFSDYAELDPLDDPFVEDVMHLPTPRQLLSSSTTILEAVELFPRTSIERFYVIHGNQVVGYLLYRHLFNPVGRLAFLALALEIEEQALRLCQHPDCASTHHSVRVPGKRFPITEEAKRSRYFGVDMDANRTHQRKLIG